MSARSFREASLASSFDSESADLAAVQEDPALTQRGLAVVDVLGAGGNSIVYRAHDPRHGRDVALKVLRRDITSDVARARFARELRVAGGLRHRHILPLFDSGTLADGRPFFVMPIAQGRPLRAMMDEGPLTVDDALRLVSEIGEALTYLHDRGWIHRDVKPENILVEGGHAVLTDFGIATRLERDEFDSQEMRRSITIRDEASDDRLTQAGKVVGTPEYMSPELLKGDGVTLDARVDVYALGVVLYEMLAGRLPRRVDTFEAWQPEPALSARRDDIPRNLALVVSRATAPEPAKRYRTVAEFVESLQGAQRPHRVFPTIRQEWHDRKGWFVIVALAFAVAVGAVGTSMRRHFLLDPRRVVVADFSNETGQPSLDPEGEVAGDVVSAALSRTRGISVINAVVALGARQRSPTPKADSILTANTLALVRQTRAGVLVTGSYFIDGRGLAAIAEVSETRSGRVLGVVGPLSFDTTRAEQGLAALADSVVTVVKLRFAPPDTSSR